MLGIPRGLAESIGFDGALGHNPRRRFRPGGSFEDIIDAIILDTGKSIKFVWFVVFRFVVSRGFCGGGGNGIRKSRVT